MKKVLVLALVLSLASIANAGLTLDVSKTSLVPSETAVITISGDGQSAPGQFYMGIGVAGPGSFILDNVTVVYAGTDASVTWLDDPGIAEFLMVNNPLLSVSLMDAPAPGTRDPYPLTGLLVDGLVFHCDGPGDVTVTIFDGDGNALSSVVIAQPEPITIGLLGLGALFLRRRK